jgi:hypothetical protein
LLLPDCFRSSDFKSSLNQVHLKIYHALKETSDLSDTTTLTGIAGIATTIFRESSLGIHPSIRFSHGEEPGAAGRAAPDGPFS